MDSTKSTAHCVTTARSGNTGCAVYNRTRLWRIRKRGIVNCSWTLAGRLWEMVWTRKLTKQRVLLLLENWLRSFHAGRHMTWLLASAGFERLTSKTSSMKDRVRQFTGGGDIPKHQFPNLKSHSILRLFPNSSTQVDDENVYPFSSPSPSVFCVSHVLFRVICFLYFPAFCFAFLSVNLFVLFTRS
jgi:hypothetical protein